MLEELMGEEVSSELPDYQGSLDYIDSLASSPPILKISKNDVLSALSIAGRDNSSITNAVFPEALPHDNRRFNPMFTETDPGQLQSGASRLTDRIATPERPYTPNEIEKIIQSPGFRKSFKSPFQTGKARVSFIDPFRTYICLKRKIRRELMHAFGFSGSFYRPRHRNYYSTVRC